MGPNKEVESAATQVKLEESVRDSKRTRRSAVIQNVQLMENGARGIIGACAPRHVTVAGSVATGCVREQDCKDTRARAPGTRSGRAVKRSAQRYMRCAKMNMSCL